MKVILHPDNDDKRKEAQVSTINFDNDGNLTSLHVFIENKNGKTVPDRVPDKVIRNGHYSLQYAEL